MIMHQPDIDIVYIDETSFHLWMQPAHCWLRDGMIVQLPKSRGHSIGVIGALSIQRGLILTKVFTGSNSTGTFMHFIDQLKAICAGTKTVVVMDNLSVHHANDVVKLFDENDFVAKFLPTYSCDLNPIEKVLHYLNSDGGGRLISASTTARRRM